MADDDKDDTWRAIDDIRHRNFMALRARFAQLDADHGNAGVPGEMKRFAEYAGLAPKYVGHLEHKRRPIGRGTCKALETAFNLPPGWMDIDRGEGVLVMDDDARAFAQLAMRLFLHDRDGVRHALMEYMERRMTGT